MRLIFIGLMFLLSCGKEDFKVKTCFMLISDAIPVQFWLNGEPSFNELDEAGVDKICFYQPWNCDDEIKIQIPVDGNGYTLKIYDEDSQLLETLNFEISGDYGIVEFTLSELNICDKLIYFKIDQDLTIIDDEFDSDLDGWTSETSTFSDPWVHSSDLSGSAKCVSSGTDQPEIFSKSLTVTENSTHYITIDQEQSGGFGNLKVRLKDALGNVLYTSAEYSSTSVIELELSYVQINGAEEIEIVGTRSGGTRTYWIKSVLVRSFRDIAYSDLQDIQENHLDTRLISYTNELDFAGIQYDVDYPPTFHIRVKSKFYTPRNQQETESEPDAEGNVIKLSSSSKKQKQLVVDPGPPYWHHKLILILQHNSVYEGNRSWVQEDNYEINEINESFGLFSGSVWLTQMDDNFYTNVF
jgi:hypothetical protein